MGDACLPQNSTAAFGQKAVRATARPFPCPVTDYTLTNPIFVATGIGTSFSNPLYDAHRSMVGTLTKEGTTRSAQIRISTAGRDLLDVEVFRNLADAQVKLALYRRYYNEQRPHSSLGNRPPVVAAQILEFSRATPSFPPTLHMTQSNLAKEASS